MSIRKCRLCKQDIDTNLSDAYSYTSGLMEPFTHKQCPTQWLAPDPVAVVTAYRRGENVHLAGYGRVNADTTISDLIARRYRILPAPPKRHTLAEAQMAYCESRWIAVFAPGFASEWFHITKRPVASAITSTCDWLIRDDDPREKPRAIVCGECGKNFTIAEISGERNHKPLCRNCAGLHTPKPVPRQVDVHEALRMYVAGGKVRSPIAIQHSKLGEDSFHCMDSEIGKPWTVLEEPKP